MLAADISHREPALPLTLIRWVEHLFQDRTSKPRNPAPVTNPDKGSHYLKKSPSPTGVKSPPGVSADDYIQRKALVTCGQQVSSKLN